MSVDFKHIEVSGMLTGKKAKAELIVVRSKDQLIKAKLSVDFNGSYVDCQCIRCR